MEISEPNIYHCAFVKNPVHPPDQFRELLNTSLPEWKASNISAVWIAIAEENADCIPIAVQAGFHIHNVEGNKLNLYLWLKDTPCTLPHTPSHYCGVGAVIVNSRDEILLMKEACGYTGNWKLPGGHVDWGEPIQDAVVREVREEMGIESSYQGVLAYRDVQNLPKWGRSDLYFICLVFPESEELQLDPNEVAEAEWKPLAEVLATEKADGIAMIRRVVGDKETDLRECLQKQTLNMDVYEYGKEPQQRMHTVHYAKH